MSAKTRGNARPLVLASASRYRRSLLERLELDFEVVAAAIDETPLAGESPAATALRLSEAKARAVAARRPGVLVIGSNQVADLDGKHVGKPGGHEAAIAQLRKTGTQLSPIASGGGFSLRGPSRLYGLEWY